MRLSRLVIVCLAALALASCASSRAALVEPRSDLDLLMYGGEAPASRVRAKPVVVQAQSAIPVAVPVMAPVFPVALPGDLPETYTLDAGDKLRIVVFGQDGLTNSYLVDPQGQIMMPLIGGVSAKGLTIKELAGSIASRLKSQGFVREPQVAIDIEIFRPFYILGEVNFPGQYPYVAHMNVEKAVAIAGGFSPRAFKWKVEIRRNISGETVRIPALLNEPVRPGDSITISERWF